MAHSSVNFKVFLRDIDDTDARRFSVDAPVVTNFMFLNEKLQSVFPSLRESEYKITWKDSDGDIITIASDEDLITALTEMAENLKVLYVTVSQRNEEDPLTIEADVNLGPRIIICDVCERVIAGFRYKCLQCPDYDLCKDCEHKGHHTEHLMVRIGQSDFFPRFTRRFMHDISRKMKKNARTARKEAYKFAKHCQKSADNCEFRQRCFPNPQANAENPNATGTSNEQTQQPPTGSCPTGQQNYGRCPFSGEKINMEDFHALGAIARQHIDPILSMLNSTAPTQQGNSERPLVYDIIQNAVDGFFGRYTQQNPSQQQKEQSQGTNQTSSQTTTETNATQPPQAPENPSPMDLDNPQTTTPSAPTQTTTYTPSPTVSAPPQTVFATSSQTVSAPQQTVPTPTASVAPSQPAQVTNPDKPAEPGWAFVAQNNKGTGTPSSSGNNGNQPNPPSPTVIYHHNPVIAEGLTRLHEMGFSNESGVLTRLLERYEGDVNQVVKALVDLRI